MKTNMITRPQSIKEFEGCKNFFNEEFVIFKQFAEKHIKEIDKDNKNNVRISIFYDCILIRRDNYFLVRYDFDRNYNLTNKNIYVIEVPLYIDSKEYKERVELLIDIQNIDFNGLENNIIEFLEKCKKELNNENDKII